MCATHQLEAFSFDRYRLGVFDESARALHIDAKRSGPVYDVVSFVLRSQTET